MLTKIGDSQDRSQFARDGEPRLPIPGEAGRTQDFVALDKGVEAVLQCDQADRLVEAPGHGDVVGRVAGLELFEKPQAFLDG